MLGNLNSNCKLLSKSQSDTQTGFLLGDFLTTLGSCPEDDKSMILRARLHYNE